MKKAFVRVYTNDEPTLDRLIDLGGMAGEMAKNDCPKQDCQIICTVERGVRTSTSEKVLAQYACAQVVELPECINVLRSAAESFDAASDALEDVGASMVLMPLHMGEEPTHTYIYLRNQN